MGPFVATDCQVVKSLVADADARGMAAAASHGFVLAVDERLAIVEDLLARNPACAVGVFDTARNITDAGTALAVVGIPLEGHACLQGVALAEFVALADIGLMAEAALEADVRGSATRTLRLRDGQPADLYLIEISDTERTTVAIIVPGAGETMAATPPPTAFVASPRVGVVLCDAFSAITSASESTLVLLGRPDQSIVGISAVHMLHPDDQEMALVNWLAAKEQRGVALRWRCRLARADGSSLWTEATITNNIQPDGTGEVRLDLCDISTEIAATDALVAERELIALLTETLPVGVAKFDAGGHLEHSNGRLTELLSPLDPRRPVAPGSPRRARGPHPGRSVRCALRAMVSRHDSSSITWAMVERCGISSGPSAPLSATTAR